MDISKILSAAPDVLEGLKGLGLDDGNISQLADEVGNQVGGGDGLDLGDILTSLTGDDFLSQLDAGAIASKVGISPDIASQALNLIAPLIENFAGDNLGALGKIAGKFFN